MTSGQTPVLDPTEACALIDSIDVATHAGLRDRALIGLMVYSFARIGAALGMAVEDVYTQNCRLWVRLREKGGKRHAMPGHHNLEEYLIPYLDGAGLRDDPQGPLFLARCPQATKSETAGWLRCCRDSKTTRCSPRGHRRRLALGEHGRRSFDDGSRNSDEPAF